MKKMGTPALFQLPPFNSKDRLPGVLGTGGAIEVRRGEVAGCGGGSFEF